MLTSITNHQVVAVNTSSQEKNLKNSKKRGSLQSSIATTPGQIQNKWFPLPSTAQRETNINMLRKAITEVKPCIDLRHVRRGRKMFSIPRIIARYKQSSFGMRELLSGLTKLKRHNIEKLVKRDSSAVYKKANTREKSNINVAVDAESTKHLLFRKTTEKDLLKNSLPATDTNSVSSKDFKTSLSIGLADCTQNPFSIKENFSVSRSTLHRNENKPFKRSNLELFSSLSSEIRASSKICSRAIDNKKQIYRVASANRGSIRLSWWL